jgi:CheY-like chemotaxis protein
MHILLIEDNMGDVLLTKEALKELPDKHQLHVVKDGEEALSYLRGEGDFINRADPDIIFLDLNLPRKDGREVLAEIKNDEQFRRIPVMVLTTSEARVDIDICYNLHANCFITKPVDINEYIDVIKGIDDFWFKIAKLPGH